MFRQAVISCLFLSAGLLRGTEDTAVPDAPSPEEQGAVISATRDAALKFGDTLPDFICTEVCRRWVAQTRTKSVVKFGDPRALEPGKVTRIYEDTDWKPKDTLTVQLSYYQQKEQYKLILLNGRPTKRSYESVGGATYYGDFWNVLGILFQPTSYARFEWDHWALLNGRRVMVFDCQVAPANSQWRISYESQEIVTGFEGLVFIEPTEHQVLKLDIHAEGIPKNFPIQRSGVELDYRAQTVGNLRYLLPLRAVEWNETKTFSTRNEVEFRLYRKFAADSKIDFETPPPLPPNQIKEEIPK